MKVLLDENLDQALRVRRVVRLFRHAFSSKLTLSYHASVIELEITFCIAVIVRLHGAAEQDMKIYLLIMLIGALLTAVHFTSAPEQRSKTIPQ